MLIFTVAVIRAHSMGEVTGWGFKVQLGSANRGGGDASLREKEPHLIIQMGVQ